MSNDAHSPAPQPVDINKRVEQYIALRDLKKSKEEALKEELAPINAAMEAVEAQIMSHMNASNAENIKTAAGTVSKLVKRTASTADASAFWTWVITQGAFDMVDKKPNQTAVVEYVKQNGVPPPGVNYSEYAHLGFRRK